VRTLVELFTFPRDETAQVVKARRLHRRALVFRKRREMSPHERACSH
jgi:hypothetical protein